MSDDFIRRIDAMQACQVGPSDEWSKSTRDGYNQAATDCAMNMLRVPAVQPDDDRIKALTAERDEYKRLALITDTVTRECKIQEARAEKAEAEVLALREVIGAVNNEFGSAAWNWPDPWRRVAQLKELSNDRWKRAEKAEADNARLRKALEPFASALKGNWSHQPDGTKILCGTSEFDLRLNLTLGDFRRAAAALNTGKETK